ncbi:Delta(3,5)-Delta(2,4)-dienoyl-CoA isomerase, mitochondrial [Erysiphe necator]|uniref:Putative enoyl-hydratase isomerase family protein n=1 Tax=Uncinula necator TaxID=52586 RepID=A0A0B1PC39_UNCNE|nr:Delta(3,5)-Delta(2,4)-dienoyl-CoA isomerase, mitochondrial [Erysiphe necator]KHJ34224.1 putative enoyl- hydratase isomerase family protein [Erysiphe necator]
MSSIHKQPPSDNINDEEESSAIGVKVGGEGGEKKYLYFIVTQPFPFVTHVEINRPEKLNSFHKAMWMELETIFDALSLASNVRVIVLSGAGDRAFCTGIDIKAALQGGILGKQKTPASTTSSQEDSRRKIDAARQAVSIRRHVVEFQKCVSSIERCEKPVICVLHGFTFGLGIDISACADIRLCSEDAKFAVKEVDIGLAADIGTLSRLPKLVGSFSWVKDVSLSARFFLANEALRVGFVSQILQNKVEALSEAFRMGQLLASKSPIAIQGTKELLNHARDHSIADSLQYTGVWNSAAIQTDDVYESLMSIDKKRSPKFEKL